MIVLFSFLDEDVFIVYEVGFGYCLVESLELFFVERHAATFNHLAHLAFAWEDLHAFLIEGVDSRLTDDAVARNMIVGHVFKDIGKCLLVELEEIFFG